MTILYNCIVYPLQLCIDGKFKTAVPLMPAYAITIPKAQRQTLKEAIIWLDSPVGGQGAGFVAWSPCRKLDNIYDTNYFFSGSTSLF